MDDVPCVGAIVVDDDGPGLSPQQREQVVLVGRRGGDDDEIEFCFAGFLYDAFVLP